jgi:hypothetical protein
VVFCCIGISVYEPQRVPTVGALVKFYCNLSVIGKCDPISCSKCVCPPKGSSAYYVFWEVRFFSSVEDVIIVWKDWVVG